MLFSGFLSDANAQQVIHDATSHQQISAEKKPEIVAGMPLTFDILGEKADNHELHHNTNPEITFCGISRAINRAIRARRNGGAASSPCRRPLRCWREFGTKAYAHGSYRCASLFRLPLFWLVRRL